MSDYLKNKIGFETSRRLVIITVLGFLLAILSLLFSLCGLYLTEIEKSFKLLLMFIPVVAITFFSFVLLLFKAKIGR